MRSSAVGRDATLFAGCAAAWIESGVSHAERAEDFSLAEDIEGFVGQALEGHAEDDESDVTVFGAHAGGGGQCSGEGGLEKFVASLGSQVELFVGGQAGGVRQQFAQRYFASARVVSRRIRGRWR